MTTRRVRTKGWTRDHFLASRQRQRNNVLEHQLQENLKHFKNSVSKCGSHTEYRHKAIINHFLARKVKIMVTLSMYSIRARN